MEEEELNKTKLELEIQKLEQEIESQRRSEVRENIRLAFYVLGIIAALIIAWTKLPL
ncbi:hypothetical protein [Pseudoalteromonas umbrosa]|uniref:hypothetical protein n=1 Tax=Pseudoalteromonas umbrosa TaxID=3048489 RepID=UPI0024C2A6ED|nr:hypothetical protein [Pseudoalteromonas sp. B95]MDK1290220.1 hypothetical protein [Pseudoalteromonas sp. B95]